MGMAADDYRMPIFCELRIMFRKPLGLCWVFRWAESRLTGKSNPLQARPDVSHNPIDYSRSPSTRIPFIGLMSMYRKRYQLTLPNELHGVHETYPVKYRVFNLVHNPVMVAFDPVAA